MIGIPVMPQDVPNAGASLLYGVRAVIENSRKADLLQHRPRQQSTARLIEMCRAACPGEGAYGISQLSPTSPLTWEPGVIAALVDTVQLGVPLAILPEPNAGVSAPFTLAGLVTMNNAEALSGVAMGQLLRPGAKLLYANSWTTTDMRSGAALVGSHREPACAGSRARSSRGSTRCPATPPRPNSDNHAHDEQNSWEKTLSQFAALAAGNDLIVKLRDVRGGDDLQPRAAPDGRGDHRDVAGGWRRGLRSARRRSRWT